MASATQSFPIVGRTTRGARILFGIAFDEQATTSLREFKDFAPLHQAVIQKAVMAEKVIDF